MEHIQTIVDHCYVYALPMSLKTYYICLHLPVPFRRFFGFSSSSSFGISRALQNRTLSTFCFFLNTILINPVIFMNNSKEFRTSMKEYIPSHGHWLEFWLVVRMDLDLPGWWLLSASARGWSAVSVLMLGQLGLTVCWIFLKWFLVSTTTKIYYTTFNL